MGFRQCVLALLAWAVAAPLAAQETRVGGEGFESPPATLTQMDWLSGVWKGANADGETAYEYWTPPIGATMVGTFIQMNGREQQANEVDFIDQLQIYEAAGTLYLNYTSTQAGEPSSGVEPLYETKRLTHIASCIAEFDNVTLQCEELEGDQRTLRVDFDNDEEGEGSDPKEYFLKYTKVADLPLGMVGDSTKKPAASSCSDAATTVEMNECAADGLRRAEAQQAKYLAASIDHHGDKPEVLGKIQASQAAFETYRDAECGGVYERWNPGSIRGVMSLTCRISLVDHRTHTIWSNWLNFILMDALLPEPKPTK